MFAQPHQEYRAADQRNDRAGAEEKARLDHDALRALKADGNAITLHSSQKYRAIARILVDLFATGFAFFFQLFQTRHNRGEKLNNNRRRNIRHNVERENSHTTNRATGKHVEHADNAGLLLTENGLQGLRVNARKRNIRAKAIDQKRTQCEPDTLLQLISRAKGRETEIGSKLFGS